MATEAERQVYPLAAPSGDAIPYDIGAPEGLWITVVDVAASAEKTLPATWDIVVLYSTVECVVGFGSGITLNLSADTEKVDHQLIPANTPVSIKLPHMKFKVIGTTAIAGVLYVQKYRRWAALSKETLQTRM